MTQPTQPTPVNPPPARQAAGTIDIPISLRGIISLAESACFIVALVLTIINGNIDPTALYTLLGGFVAHGVNHPAGGSPI